MRLPIFSARKTDRPKRFPSLHQGCSSSTAACSRYHVSPRISCRSAAPRITAITPGQLPAQMQSKVSLPHLTGDGQNLFHLDVQTGGFMHGMENFLGTTLFPGFQHPSRLLSVQIFLPSQGAWLAPFRSTEAPKSYPESIKNKDHDWNRSRKCCLFIYMA